MIFKIRLKEKSINFIDNKQQFTAISEYEGKLKYLYEVDIKTRNSFSSPEHIHFLNTFQIFKDSTSIRRKLAYKIHYTAIPCEELGNDLRGWFVFKLTIGLNQKVNLNSVLHSVKLNLNKKNTEIIKSRIVSNPEKLDAVVYFEQLNKYLKENHQGYVVANIDQVFHDN